MCARVCSLHTSVYVYECVLRRVSMRLHIYMAMWPCFIYICVGLQSAYMSIYGCVNYERVRFNFMYVCKMVCALHMYMNSGLFYIHETCIHTYTLCINVYMYLHACILSCI